MILPSSSISRSPAQGAGSAPLRSGFTIIELLVVVAILAILAGLLMPIVGVARKASMKTASLSVMHKTDAAIRLYHADVGVFPYAQTYADIDNGVAWTNNLYYSVGTKIAQADLDHLYADAKTAAANYDYPVPWNWNNTCNEITTFASKFTYRADDVVKASLVNINAWDSEGGDTVSRVIFSAVILNRMAKERARLAIFSGDIAVSGLPLPGTLRVDPSTTTTPLVASPVSAPNPGWADDYLDGNLEKRFISGTTILDAYKHPLIYVCQVVEGARSPRAPVVMDSFAAVVDQSTYHFTTAGRTVLDVTDPDGAAGLARPDSTPALPSHNVLRHSDRRYYSARGFENEFELWSAGTDGKASWWRDDPRNQDNVGLVDYDRGLP